MNLKELLEKLETKKAEMRALLETARTENRTLNNEERASFDEIEKEIQDINASIDALERMRAVELINHEGEEDQDDNDPEERDVETREIEVFEAFIRNNAEELRSGEIQMTQGANGAIVPTTIANQIVTAIRDKVPYLQIANVVNTNGKLSIPVYGEDSTNYINADYVDEGDPLTDNIGKFTTVDLTGFVIGALALVSNKLVSNTDINITEFVVNEVSRAMAEKLEKEFTVGTSSKIEGITSGPVKVTANSATAVTYDELVSLKHSIKQEFRKNGKWVMNDSTYEAICKLKDGESRPYFNDDDYKILGCDVMVSDSMPAMATGNKAIVFADFSGYTIKATKSVEVQILREKYADRNMLGVIAYGEYDAKVSDTKKVAVLKMA